MRSILESFATPELRLATRRLEDTVPHHVERLEGGSGSE